MSQDHVDKSWTPPPGGVLARIFAWLQAEVRQGKLSPEEVEALRVYYYAMKEASLDDLVRQGVLLGYEVGLRLGWLTRDEAVCALQGLRPLVSPKHWLAIDALLATLERGELTDNGR